MGGEGELLDRVLSLHYLQKYVRFKMKEISSRPAITSYGKVRKFTATSGLVEFYDTERSRISVYMDAVIYTFKWSNREEIFEAMEEDKDDV